MAELPGWDRPRLATAADGDVTAARWMVYARVLAPEVTFDYPSRIHQIELADMKPRAREHLEHQDRLRALEALRRSQVEQARLRRLLLLDGPDDQPDPDA